MKFFYKDQTNCLGFKLNKLEELSCQIKDTAFPTTIPLMKIFLRRTQSGEIKAQAFLNMFANKILENPDNLVVSLGGVEYNIEVQKNLTSGMYFSATEEEIYLDPNNLVGNILKVQIANIKS